MLRLLWMMPCCCLDLQTRQAGIKSEIVWDDLNVYDAVHEQREVRNARARVETAQQALFAELQRAQQRERQLAAERAAAARDRAVREQRAAEQRAAAQRALQAAATQVCSDSCFIFAER